MRSILPNPILALSLLLVSTPSPARGANTACEAIAAADLAALGYRDVRPGSSHSPSSTVKLDSNAAISGRETECLWTANPGSLVLILGDMDANLVKGADVARLGHKVVASAREMMELAGTYSGRAYTFSVMPGVGEEAFTARLDESFFEVVARQGLRLVRLKVGAPPGMARKPTPEQAGALVARILAGPGGYTTAGAPAVKGEQPWSGPDDRTTVTGSIVASGALSGVFTWKSPGAVETYPDRTEIVLSSADRSTFMNLQVWNGQDRVAVRSGKLSAGVLEGAGRTSTVNPLRGEGVITVDATVRGGAEVVTVRGTLTVRPVRK